MQVKMPGARRRGTPCTVWMDNINTWTGLPLEESIRMKEDRESTANPRIEDSEQNRTVLVWPARILCLVETFNVFVA